MEHPVNSELLTSTKFVVEYNAVLDNPKGAAGLFFGISTNNTVIPQIQLSHWRHENENQLREFEAQVSRAFIELCPIFLSEAAGLAFGIAYERQEGNAAYNKRGKVDRRWRAEIAERAGKRARKLAKTQQALRTEPGRNKKPLTKRALCKAFNLLGRDVGELRLAEYLAMSDTTLRSRIRELGFDNYRDMRRHCSNPK